MCLINIPVYYSHVQRKDSGFAGAEFLKRQGCGGSVITGVKKDRIRFGRQGKD